MAEYSFDYYAKVEQVVCDILNQLGIDAEQDISGLGSAGWLVASVSGNRYNVNMNISRNAVFTDTQVWGKLDANPHSRKMEVFVGAISEKMRQYAAKEHPNHIVLDICNLLHMVRGHDDLRQQLVQVLAFSVDGFQPIAPDQRIRISPRPVHKTERRPGYTTRGWESPGEENLDTRGWENRGDAALEELLRKWDPKLEKSGDYEKLCCRALNRLFADDLSLWQEQQKSNDGLFRFDMICKIKNGNQKDFWQTAERYFHSKYIVFEYKNYTGFVTQKEVYTTVKYLYGKALRGIAILVSPNGLDEHAEKAIRGILREEGKLILNLTNRELVEMLEGQKKGRIPADYLSGKLDELLINLEK